MKIWIKRILQGLGILALLGILYAAFAPLPMDERLPEDKWGAGASSVLWKGWGRRRACGRVRLVRVLSLR